MTPEYASPEQIRGDVIGVGSDVYTLGVVLYQLLTGRLPFHQTEGGVPELMRVVCEQEARKPSTVVGTVKKELAGDLDNIVLMAMRKEPERRYGSAEQLGEDIRRYLEGQPVAARPSTAGYRAGKFLKRHRYAAIAAALFVASLIGGIAATTRQARIAEANAARAQQRFEDLRQLAGKFLFDVEHEIAPLPGSTKARKKVVEMANQYLALLAEEKANDPLIAAELALSYAMLGGIQRSRNQHSLGDSAGARASYLRSLELSNTAISQWGPTANALQAKARALSGLGDLALLDGNNGASGQHHRDALATIEQAMAMGKGKLQARTPLTYIGKLAQLHSAEEQHAEALPYYQKAAALTEALLRESPEDFQALRDRSVSLAQLGQSYRRTNDPDKAIATFEQALGLIARMRAQRPGTGDRDELVLEANMGLAYSEKKEYRQALEHHRRQLAIAIANLKKDKDSVLTYYDLSAAHEQLAKVLIEDGRAEEAKPHVAASLEVVAQAEKMDANSTMTMHHLNSAIRTNALMHEALRNADGAEQAYRQLVERNERAARQIPSPGMKQQLAASYSRAAEFHRAQAMKGPDRQRHLFEVHRLLNREIEVRRQLRDEDTVAELQQEIQQLRASTSR